MGCGKKGGGGPISLWIGGRETYNVDTPSLVVGEQSIDPAEYKAKQVYFRAVAAMGDTVDAEVELYNLTDAATVATLTFSSTSPAMQQTLITLAIGAKIYEARVHLAAASVGVNDSVELYSAEIKMVS